MLNHRNFLNCILLAGGIFALPSLAQNIPNTLAQRLKACTSCHGAQGRAASDGYYPRLAGKPEGYLLHQLKNFRDGQRRYPLMNSLLSNLSDAYLQEIAAFFADQHPPYASPQPTEASLTIMVRGRELVMEGDQQKKLPACISCHGEKMTGVAPFIPGVIGLPRDYIVAQLGAWQTGSRRAHAPDCMRQLAQRLAPADIAAVSAWLASQTVPDNGIAVSAKDIPRFRLPLQCGSVSEDKQIK